MQVGSCIPMNSQCRITAWHRVLKWVMMGKLQEYLLNSLYTLTISHLHMLESTFRAAQIRWLSDFAVLDFDIKYGKGTSNQAADILTHHPVTND